MNILNNYLSQILLAILLALAAFLGAQVRNLYRKYVTTEIKQAVCKTAVLFVEQVYKDIHGPEKLAKAMAQASAMLHEYGIEISDTELISMLEAAVREFINSFNVPDVKGRHEEGQTDQEIVRKMHEILDDYAAEAAETGGTATLEEIIADLKDTE